MSYLGNYMYHVYTQLVVFMLLDMLLLARMHVAIALSCALSMHTFHRNVTTGPLTMCG